MLEMRMKFLDQLGSLYSEKGLRFGGYKTIDFLLDTELLEKKRPGIRKEIIAEAHYLIFWTHSLSEIAFLLGIHIYKSTLYGMVFFIVAYLLELARFYLFGSSLFLSKLAFIWKKTKFYIFLIFSVILWQESKFLSIVVISFYIIQGKFALISVITSLPAKYFLFKLLLKHYGEHNKAINMVNIEGLAIDFVIKKWNKKIPKK